MCHDRAFVRERLPAWVVDVEKNTLYAVRARQSTLTHAITRLSRGVRQAILVDDPKARLVQFLIHVGANVDAVDEEGNTALIVAGFFERSAEAVDK
jgi:hypothetical protein